MNYRHAFHAGNFADLIKHAVVLRLLREMRDAGGTGPIMVIDTHAGAGLYDLEGEAARRTGEAAAGISRLMADGSAPAVFDELKGAVRRANPPGALRVYPGSPVLIAKALKAQDRYMGAEARADDAGALRVALTGLPAARVHEGDGWAYAAKIAPAAPAKLMVLIDPPFEQGGDYQQAARLTARTIKTNPGAVIAVWTPIKDLATFDAFLTDMDEAAAGRPPLVVEIRLRPLDDPTRLNGCALVVVNAPTALDKPAGEAAAWIAQRLGEAGGLGRVWR